MAAQEMVALQPVFVMKYECEKTKRASSGARDVQPDAGVNRSFWRRHLPLESETCFFILANALDAIVTKWLLQFPQFRESNVVADWVLGNFGMRSMIWFKFCVVACVVVIAQIIATRNVRTARLLLNFGSALTFGVVAYSCYLWFRHSAFYSLPW